MKNSFSSLTKCSVAVFLFLAQTVFSQSNEKYAIQLFKIANASVTKEAFLKKNSIDGEEWLKDPGNTILSANTIYTEVDDTVIFNEGTAVSNLFVQVKVTDIDESLKVVSLEIKIIQQNQLDQKETTLAENVHIQSLQFEQRRRDDTELNIAFGSWISLGGLFPEPEIVIMIRVTDKDFEWKPKVITPVTGEWKTK